MSHYAAPSTLSSRRPLSLRSLPLRPRSLLLRVLNANLELLRRTGLPLSRLNVVELAVQNDVVDLGHDSSCVGISIRLEKGKLRGI